MKSPKSPPPPPPTPPPVTATGAEVEQAEMEAKRKAKGNYDFGKTILRPGGLSAKPAGTLPTLGR